MSAEDIASLDWVGIITAVGACITAIGVILAGFWSYRSKQKAAIAAEKAEANGAKIVELDGKLYQLGANVDGRLTELLRTSTAAAHAEGVISGEQAQRDRQSPRERK